MADVKKINFDNGDEYDIKDEEARNQIQELNETLTECFRVRTYTASGVTTPANSLGSVVTFDVTPPDGYTNIGIVGYNTNNTYLGVNRFWLSDANTVSAYLYSYSSNDITNNQYVYVLAVKSELVS